MGNRFGISSGPEYEVSRDKNVKFVEGENGRIYIYTPKIMPSKLFCGDGDDVRMGNLQSFYFPKILYLP